MAYRVTILPSAVKELSKLDKTVAKRIGRAIAALGPSPRPAGCKKLVGVDAWRIRIRIGDWRVIYQIRDQELLVLVIRIGHRREIYK